MILKRSRKMKKYALLTEPNETVEYSQLKGSVGEEAKQHLREISQLCYLNNDYVKELDWSSSKQEVTPKNLEKIKGCFEINLKNFQTKTLNANNLRSIKKINEERQKPKQQISQQKRRFQRSKQGKKLKDICISRKYTIGDSNRNQSRIHSINQHNIQSKDPYFMIDENAFKTAALKLHNHFKCMQSPITTEKKSQTRIQSQLVVHKKRIQKITSNPQPSQHKSVKYILVSPKKQINYSIPLANSMLQIQKRRISTAARASFLMNQKSIPTTV